MQRNTSEPQIRVLAIGSGSLQQLLVSGGNDVLYASDLATSIESGLEKLRRSAYDVVLVELSVCHGDQRGILRHLSEACPDADVILLGEESTPRDVIDAIRSNAFAYFGKPFDSRAIHDMILSAAAVQEPAGSIEILSANQHYLTLRLRCSLFTVDRLVRFMAEIPIELSEDDRREVGT